MNFKKIFAITKEVAIAATTIGVGIIVNEAVKKVIPVNASMIKKILMAAGAMGISELVSTKAKDVTDSFFESFEELASSTYNVIKNVTLTKPQQSVENEQANTIDF